MALNLPIRYGGAVVGDEEVKAINAAIQRSIETGNWQTGEEARLMEEESAAYLGVKHGILCNSGSSAGLLALSALELPKGSEVIIPAITFSTIFNIILQCGLRPVLADCRPDTYVLDLDKLPISEKTRAIIAVHAVGNAVDMPRLLELTKNKNIYVIEDNCDGWSGSISGRSLGSFGDVSITSFHAAHIVSMGVGGGVYTNDDNLATKVRQYRDWGRQANLEEKENTKYPKLPKDQNPRFIYEKIGFNFQILELQAAMGRVQLKKSEEIKRKRQENFEYLVSHLLKHPDLVFPQVIGDVCWFAFPLSVEGDRAPILKFLEEHQIETRTIFGGIVSRHPAYDGMRFKHGDLSGAEEITKKGFWISCHPRLSQEDLDYVISVFDKYYAQSSTG